MELANSTTTLVASHAQSGELLVMGDVPLDTLRELSDHGLLRCPHCGGLLRLKAGTIRLPHFAHVALAECHARDSEPESEAHRAGKLALYQHFRQGASHAALEYPVRPTNQRADVFIAPKYVLEFQQANNTFDQWCERHRLYASQGLLDVWFLGQIRYTEAQRERLRPISPYDPRRMPRDTYEASAGAFRVRELERAILETFGVLYYLNPEDDRVTCLLPRELNANTLRAYRYIFPLNQCHLNDAGLWTPITPFVRPARGQ
ncbi:MAG: hypothetical protein OHK0023_05430 [Anaerolineae bacterium]